MLVAALRLALNQKSLEVNVKNKMIEILIKQSIQEKLTREILSLNDSDELSLICVLNML